ncbi:MAG: glycosyltransferase family 2 protein [Christensenellales bacterium]|jgi:glycosyltransferase involved in cell wall biosynthesis
MKEPLVSVIVPVYNAERKLRASAGSVINQDYRNIEVLLVNDGSTDDSLSICSELVAKDSRFRLYDQPNGGPGAARNTALQAAEGEYVLFVDSDDELLPGAITSLVRAMQESDLVIGCYYFEQSGNAKKRGLVNQNCTMNRDTFLSIYVKKPGSYYFSALWNKLYRMEIIQSMQLQFVTGLDWGEDFIFNTEYNNAVHRVSFITECVYRYTRTVSGITLRTLHKVIENILTKKRMYLALKKLFMDQGTYAQYRLYVTRYIFNITLFN